MRIISTAIFASCLMPMMEQTASTTFEPAPVSDINVYFSVDDEGEAYPILWGLDTAWDSEENIRRGIRYMGSDIIGVARVSFQPIDFLTEAVLSDRQEANLVERLRKIALINGVGGVKIVLNNDTPEGMYLESLANSATDPAACEAYCNVIYATALSCQEKGWEVITASPLNEPDYIYNLQGSQDDFLAIAKKLKTYPQFSDGSIRISGGNTLNCDQAQPWYDYLRDYIDEGNTHQLAGVFDNYASFFENVRADGKYATADELHNIMEAMVGVTYGMQTGIWWGTAEYARGEFCKASGGQRLAYDENRKAWTSAGVYRAPDGKIQGFVGTSERQALECGYRFVSKDRDVFYNGYGPSREFYTSTPGGTNYQDKQTNAECVINITWGEDVQPVIDGNYKVMNKLTGKPMGIKGTPANWSVPTQYTDGDGTDFGWEVKPVDEGIGGDYSYFTFNLASKNNFKLDVTNWSLEDGGSIILYDGGLGNNEQWGLKYAGDGYFRIFSRHSALYLTLKENSGDDGVYIVQKEWADDDAQLWRFMPVDAECTQEAPAVPIDLRTESRPGGVWIDWTGCDCGVTTAIILRAGEDGEYNTIARDVATDYFFDNMALPGVTYSYKVKTVDYSGNISEASEPVKGRVSDSHALLAQWMLDQELTDCTTNGNNLLSPSSLSQRYAKGQNDAYSLNVAGNRFVSMPYALGNREEATYCAWLTWRTTGGNQAIFSLERDADHYCWLGINEAGNLGVTIKNGDDEISVSGGSLTAKEWAHVAYTITPDEIAIYLNGEEVAREANSAALTPAAVAPGTCYLGKPMAYDADYLNAYVQDARVYNYALSASEMAQAMDLSGITSAVADNSPVVATEYYNLQGMRISQPASGTVIRVTIHADGSRRSQKLYVTE